ncbi:MAG TPA: TrmH family RNA methyltransferase [Candidatus Paceibacterota bacterium]|nr:TrmH family RNA methyltransferase [Candidatus Paceibacterota bacterium]
MKSCSYLILHNIRSAHNVGSIFRTADAAGVAKVFISGYTPQPIDRFGRPVGEIAKTALGAEQTVPWEYQESVSKIITSLRKQSVEIIALEQDAKSVDYKKYKPAGSFALLLGNEVEGVEKKLLKRSDAIVEIPMAGEKESLNVSVAAGIALFRLLGL